MVSELEFYGRVQTAGEVAEAIAFLASGRSPYLNGCEVPLDTGFGNMLASVELKRRPPLENFWMHSRIASKLMVQNSITLSFFDKWCFASLVYNLIWF